MFVDLGGFTNFTAENGDDAAGRLLATFRALVREVSSQRGVRVAKWLGDGCMMVAMDQRDGIAVALDIEARAEPFIHPLSLRVGIASGYALLFEGDDYIGSAVNLAARLCDASGAFEVLLPAKQLETLPEGAIATPHGFLELRGFTDPIEVVELSGYVANEERNDTGELWTRSPFVG